MGSYRALATMEKETQTDKLPGVTIQKSTSLVIRKPKKSLLNVLLVELMPIELFTCCNLQYARRINWSIAKGLVLSETLAVIMMTVALAFLSLEEVCYIPERTLEHDNSTEHVHYLNYILDIQLTKPVMDVTLGMILVIGVVWMAFSAMFVVGILKNNATYVMSYFLFGTAICIMYLLSALLEVVNGTWAPSLITAVLTGIYVRCLISVYSFYEMLLKRNSIDDCRQLITDEEFGVEV